MADPSQLERIAGLAEQLAPLGGKRRRMRIEAEEWNTLVVALGTVLEIERAHERTDQAVLGQTAATRDRLEVIDGQLQAQLADGGASISTRVALAEAEKKVEALGTEVARLTALAEEQRTLLDRSSVDELERANALRAFEDRFRGVEDLRGVVTTLGADVRGVRTGVDTVLELSTSLSDEQGNRLDVLALRDEVAALGELRTNLAGVDGQLLRMRDIEVQLVELQDAVGLGGGAGLDARIANARAEIEESLGTKLEEDVGTLRNDLLAQGEATKAELQVAQEAALAGARGELEQLVAARAAENEQQLASAVAEARSGLEAQVEAIRAELTANVPEAVKAAVDGALSDLDARVAVAVDGRLVTLDQRVAAAVGSALVDLPQRIDSELVPRMVKLREELADMWRLELGESEGRQERSLKESLAAFETRNDSRLEELLGPIDSRLRKLEDAVFRIG